MKLRVLIDRINKHIRIDKEHSASSFHDIVESITVCNINQVFPSMEPRQWRQLFLSCLLAVVKKQPQRRFDQLGHGLTLPSRFPPETAHDGIVDVKRRLHMENHIHDMAICQSSVG